VAADVLFFMQILLHMRNGQKMGEGYKIIIQYVKDEMCKNFNKRLCRWGLAEGSNHKFVEQGATWLFKQSNTQRRCFPTK